eukprot:9119760-Lingulodinium_polyedra.AAC.1
MELKAYVSRVCAPRAQPVALFSGGPSVHGREAEVGSVEFQFETGFFAYMLGWLSPSASLKESSGSTFGSDYGPSAWRRPRSPRTRGGGRQ